MCCFMNLTKRMHMHISVFVSTHSLGCESSQSCMYLDGVLMFVSVISISPQAVLILLSCIVEITKITSVDCKA